MELVSEISIDRFIIKQPYRITNDDAVAGAKNVYIGQIWYKKDDGTVIKPILHVPRLKILFNAKKFKGKNPYTYCVSLTNRDIDDEINAWFDLVQELDKFFMQLFKKNEKKWAMNNIKKIYRSAMNRKCIKDEYYFKLKLIQEGDKILTDIKSTNRAGNIEPEEIKYGRYIDQYVCPDFISFSSDGIDPVWTVHQAVVSPIEKIFLGTCLLGEVAPHLKQELVPKPLASSRTLEISSKPPPRPMSALGGLIKQEDLLKCIKALKTQDK